MTIKLYQNKSEMTKVSKSITEIAAYNGTLRDKSCSVVDPKILFESSNPPEDLVNYMYIPKFNRYYFVYSIDSIRKDLWQITGHVDVLMSFKSDIKASTQLIARQENRKNNYLVDSSLPIGVKRQFKCIEFGDAFVENPYYILTVMGGIPREGE